MQNKRIIFLLAVLVISVGYSWVSLFVLDDPLKTDISFQAKKAPQALVNKADTRSPAGSNMPVAPIESDDTSRSTSTELPAKFLLMGTMPTTPDALGKALIQYRGGLIEYEENSYLLETAMRLKQVNTKSVDVEYNNTLFTVALTPPNLLAPDYRNPDLSRTAMLEMTPEEIGTRPRIIEHLFVLTTTPYIADGKLVNPGLNPALFSQAGFQEDDVLKTINGKSVTIEEDIEAIKEELKTAQTLKFEVMRKGRIVILYLDIPSEALKLSID